MEVHHGLEHLPQFTNPVVTIGSFDGVHIGHRAIISQVIAKAKEANGDSVIVTFDPHPRQVVFPNDRSLRLLSTLDEKILLLRDTGLDHLIVIPFTIEFSQINPYDYVDKILIEKIGVYHLIIGYDHRFGLNREGNIDLLTIYKNQGVFTLQEIPEQEIDDLHVSSTAVRNHLIAGEIESANRILGSPYLIAGRIKKGRQIARDLGFPTANCTVQTDFKLIPATGTYAAYARVDDEDYKGMLYIGESATLGKTEEVSVEINLFAGISSSLYDKEIEIRPLKRIRPDQRFSNRDELLYNIKADRIDCELYFQSESNKIISTSILNYNGADYLSTFLPSHIKQTSLSEVVVVDNASTDDSIKNLKKFGDNVKVISLSHNRGFAGGYTESMEDIDSKYVAIVNSDVEVTDGWLTPLLDALEKDEKLVAVQPKVLAYNNKKTFEHAGAAGGFVDALGYPYCRGRILDKCEKDDGQYDDKSEVFWTSGAAMVARVDAFRQAGGFDVDFFAHMEEIDLCWRWKKAGYHLKCIPESVVYHVGGGTLSYQNPRKAYLNLRNNYWMLLKNENIESIIWILPIRLFFDTQYAIKNLSTGNGRIAFQVLKGMCSGILKVFTISSKRKTIKQYIKRYKIGPANKKERTRIWLPFEIVRGKNKWSQIHPKG